MSRSFDLDPCTRFTAGAIGEPGRRTFLVQARSSETYCTLLGEKEQIAVLARELGRILAMLPEVGSEGVVPDPIDLELVEPLEPDWRIGSMSIEYDPERDRLILLLREFLVDDDDELVELDEEDDDESVDEDDLGGDADEDEDANGAIARLCLTRAQVRAMVARTAHVVDQGRPLCELCSLPIEPGEPHHCPGMNGHRKRDG